MPEPVEARVRRMSKAERRMQLTGRGWTRVSAYGAESWRHPSFKQADKGSLQQGDAWTLAAAVRAALRAEDAIDAAIDWDGNRPVLPARREGVHLKVWCHWCNREHWHGVCGGAPDCPCIVTKGRRNCTCPKGSGDGHRRPHCHDSSSPYDNSGYILREVERS